MWYGSQFGRVSTRCASYTALARHESSLPPVVADPTTLTSQFNVTSTILRDWVNEIEE